MHSLAIVFCHYAAQPKIFLMATLILKLTSTIPIEMLEGICQFLSQKGLFSLMLCNSKFSESAAQYLYMEPEFASTYRFAQFAFIVVNRPHCSRMVRSLDISRFQNVRDNEGKLMEMDGWREFKYHHHQMFEVFGRSSYGPSFCTCLSYRSLEEQQT